MRFFRQIIAVMILLCATLAQAGVVEGRDYKVLNPPQPVSSGNKIEVLEFFFYGCSHCYHLHPALNTWEKSKPADVDLQPVPVIFRDNWEPMARTFYALESMGQLKQHHDALFEAWNVFNNYLIEEAQVIEFLSKRGMDKTKFRAAYNSFSVGSKVMRSKQLVQAYALRGTPTVAVDGKYIITGLSPEETIRVLDEVIKIARKERSGRK
ncbi:MAG: thiol:disulfide interchange protein DsbA/DsbL [Gallionellaceae bacterium]|nr:thiol:disulfide interchange protein DsbA/DsbL [Gallionellaceae bacterium]